MVRRITTTAARNRHSLDQWTRWGLAGLLVGLAVAAIYWRAAPVRESDPDRYFHLEMARRTAETGHIRQMKETADLNLGQPFHNSYWFFTWVSSLGYKLGGEQGALGFGFVCALATLLLLLWVAHENLSIGISMLVLLGVLLSPDAMNRLFLYRPHLLSMLLFSLMVVGMLRSNRYVTFASGVLHAWSYQATFLPAVVLLLAIPFRKRQGRDWLFAIITGFAGLLVGVLSHPYFPTNVWALLGVLEASAPSTSIPDISMPMEFGGMTVNRAVMNLSFFLLPLVLMVIRGVPRFRKLLFKQDFKLTNLDMAWLTLCLALFWALSFVTARALEYVIPLAVLGWVYFIREWKNPATQARFLLLGMVLCLPMAWNSYVRDERVRLSPRDIIAAIRTLPEDAEGKKVLNMDWSHGAHVLYARPGYGIVDYGDPRPLASHRPDLYELRQQLASGMIADPFGVVKFGFGAEYVLTFAGPFQAQMEASPHFRKYAVVDLQETPGVKLYIYQAAPVRLPLQVKNYDFKAAAGREVSSDEESGAWKVWGANSQVPAERRTTFVNLGAGSEAGCSFLRPELAQQAYVYGTSLLAIGGAGDVKVYFNGAKLFRGELGKKNVRETELVLNLPKPLTKKDRLLVEVCGLDSQVLTGFTASLFSPKLLSALCTWKYGAAEASASPQMEKDWKYGVTAGASCLAPYAVKQL